jgi:hypothetical protein
MMALFWRPRDSANARLKTLRVYDASQAFAAQESLNQVRGLLDDELLPRKEFYALFHLGRTIVKMLGEQIGD